MKIALVGYGQMGHMLRSVAEKRGHTVVLTVDTIAKDADLRTSSPEETAKKIVEAGAEAVIEFSHPTAVMGNIEAILPSCIPLIVGTTGWNNKIDDVRAMAEKKNAYIFQAANYSIGVNLFYKIVEEAAKIVSAYSEYDCAIWEAHHTKKADSPSGTALVIAEKVMAQMPSKKQIVTDAFHERPNPEQLHVSSTRLGSVPGTHKVYFDSTADTIELTHTVRSREGLALGAVHAAEWMVKNITEKKIKPGMYSMDDLME